MVIGGSLGAIEALSELFRSLRGKPLDAAVFVVVHISADHPSVLPDILTRVGWLPASHPVDGEPIQHGHVYVAPPDRHLIVEPGRVRVVRGPKENNVRPAVDVLFRSAAAAYGPRVIAVQLTGALDCGVAGLQVVQSRGGVVLVQDPDEAECPDMPRAAIERLTPNLIAPLRRLGREILKRAKDAVGDEAPARGPIRQEVRAVEIRRAPPLGGKASVYTCPECHGTLWELEDQGLLRYRCRVGHAYTAETLVGVQSDAIESALWAAVRALDEAASLNARMATRAKESQRPISMRRYEEKAETARGQAELLRQALLSRGVEPQGGVEPDRP